MAAQEERRSAWLSHGFGELAQELPTTSDPVPEPHFDFVIVGSGYGGAVAAAGLSTLNGARVCVLERGSEYLPGSFPSRLAQAPGHVRFSSHAQGPRGLRTGLFDFRLGDDVSALLANGLGGGSLINAGVMEPPKPEVFHDEAWPMPIRKEAEAELKRWFDAARKLVGASVNGVPNVWKGRLDKLEVLRELGPNQFIRPPLTIAQEDRPSAAGVELKKCVSCGDCATGCNYGAKESLDTNLLVQARRNRAAIYCGATVLRLAKRPGGGWLLYVNHTDEKLRRRQGDPLLLAAKNVILAGGTYGSTEILLRSRSPSLNFSDKLGTRFSANGDSLASLIELKRDANAVANESETPSARAVGPTITGLIDLGDAVIEDLTIPGSLRRLFQETSALAAGFDDLSRGDDTKHTATDRDPCAIDEAATKHTLVVAVLGPDSAGGRIELQNSEGDDNGAVRVFWPEARDDERLSTRHARVEAMQRESDLGGRTLANPLWRLLPPQLEFLFDKTRGPVLTVHPLGGCPMADDVQRGVVDDAGRVFALTPRSAESEVHEGLFVLDGSIIPRSLGINPALTITALALRALEKHFRVALNTHANAEQRPVFRTLDPAKKPDSQTPTTVQVIERAWGHVSLPGRREPYVAQLTLEFQPKELAALMDPAPANRSLSLDGHRSELRLFELSTWSRISRFPDREEPDDSAVWIAEFASGELRFFQREAGLAKDRRRRALSPWFFNRGARDTFQELRERCRGQSASSESKESLREYGTKKIDSFRKLASFAGEVRLFDYELRPAKAKKNDIQLDLDPNTVLRITKRLTYTHRASPWNQLMHGTLEPGPFHAPSGFGGAKLSLDLRFLERRGTPLFRLVEQADQVTALVDVAAWMLYLLRIMLRVQTWSFRKPDSPSLDAPAPNRFPRAPRSMEIRQIDRLRIKAAQDAPRTEPEAFVQLTRFRTRRGGHGEPVLMIHGYSVSGSTFAHPAAPSLAKHLWRRGWDPWVIDLRTSAALETARYGWSFEQVGYADIPFAVDHILKETRRKKLSIVAHCMGSAMTSMALLGDLPAEMDPDTPPLRYLPPDPYPELREKLRSSVAALVLSQVTPYTLFTPANVFRAFTLRYLFEFFNTDNYQFRVEGKPRVRDQLLDRFLMTLPYPESEFYRENPPLRFWARTPWTATRHRMDALYGRDFSVRNIKESTLKYIDDLFGPLSIRTVSQGIQFARYRVVTDKTGLNQYVTAERLRRLANIPILTLHGAENGLVDAATRNYVQQVFAELKKRFPEHDWAWETRLFKGYGHQDSLIGKRSACEVFPEISNFLETHVGPKRCS